MKLKILSYPNSLRWLDFKINSKNSDESWDFFSKNEITTINDYSLSEIIFFNINNSAIDIMGLQLEMKNKN